MLKSETLAQGGGKRRNRDGGTGRKPGIKTSGGSMKSPNLVLRLKLDHNVSANCGKKQLAGKNNVYQLCVRLQWPIVWTQKAFLKKKRKEKRTTKQPRPRFLCLFCCWWLFWLVVQSDTVRITCTH